MLLLIIQTICFLFLAEAPKIEDHCMKWIDDLIQQGYLKTPRIVEAFRKVHREDFVSREQKHLAEKNIPIRIGFNQTNSQPLVVAFMLELLDPKGKVLDVGAGSGWTSVLLAHLADYVWGLECIPELLERAKDNSQKYACNNLELICTENSLSHPPAGKVDRILVSASASKKEDLGPLFDQLKPDGILVAPIQDSLWKFQEKKAEEHPGFLFVPLRVPIP